ncbi:patatin-like phospholipase family protein [Aureibaculum sp. 2210JD6-5]|uniref:patatin-like phospholipase family protein n=1 Tax=Aureibaculum sp. 2210JD6-5 TaxID=3103957 RepID=UPI002AAF01AD|nr:patatin-like phospholipase family protein [Aureibaculum sp. 2210JD6-5]MDY7396975.1 patatin-like phospholipase family protein [Aureibaculum sp. 2210JD6-5]
MAKNRINPLNRIALCLSGGGYRASTFQLGMLSYLNSKKLNENSLLENVKAISTVSGGTITGVYYAALIQEGKSFEEIYKNLYNWLVETDLVKKSFEMLNESSKWNYNYKRKNIVNAFAELYDKTLLDGRTMGSFANLKKSHLEFVCFNSTEFYSGLRYRFQTSYFGSYGLRLSKEIYNYVRLGDVIAASSAFSGGFEPISMPDDFFDPDSESFRKIKRKSIYKDQSIGLMDGGIVDNQGISSILDYEDNEKIEPFDVVLISDVASPYITPFKFSEIKDGKIREKSINDFIKSVKVKRNLVYVLLFLILGIGVFLLFLSDWNNSTIFGIGISMSIITTLLLLLWYFINKKVKGTIDKTLEYVGKMIPEYFKTRIRVLKISDVKIKYMESLLIDRLESLKLLVPTIFLKQIRRLHYNKLYQNKEYDFRRMDCLIKELTSVDFEKKFEKDYKEISKYLAEFKGDSYKEIMGGKIKTYLDKAASFGTTLWFTDDKKELEEQLKSLIISGQITCCQNLLIYLTKLIYSNNSFFNTLEISIQESLKDLHKSTLKDWETFKKNPEFLFIQY